MRTRPSHRMTIVLSLLAMICFGTAALGLPTVAGIVYFYSDSTYSTQVGYIWWTCNGRSQSGTTSSYPVAEEPFDSCEGGDGYYCTWAPPNSLNCEPL